MRLKLILKKIISNVKTKNLTKTDATELIISLIEKCENAEVRAACIDSLVTLNVKTEKIYKIFELVDLNLDAWYIFHRLNIPELHDRMIAATFYYYKARGLITNNPEISESLPMIWK
ncbi:MAG TPA: hypothetical protein ENI29_22940 [bacterium]|nr:hypothetical protein [bacterium]